MSSEIPEVYVCDSAGFVPEQCVQEISLENFDKICRTCLSAEVIKKNIFEITFEDINLGEVFEKSTSIEVHKHDNLPQQICIPCIKELICMYSFKRKCLQSDLILRALLVVPVKEETESKGDDNTIDTPKEKCNVNIVEKITGHRKKTRKSFKARRKVILRRKNSRTWKSTAKKQNADKVQENNCVPVEVKSESPSDNDENVDSFNCEPNSAEDDCSVKQQTESRRCRNRNAVESSGPPYTCCHCNELFASVTELRTHRNETKHPRPRNHVCKVCFKAFTFSHLKQHVRSHTKEKPFQCQICFMQFSLNCNLKRHILTHTGERPHTCDTCGKGFIQATTLVEHKRTHTGETPFICSYCGKTFSQSARHKSHLRKHLIENGEAEKFLKENQCNVCERIFSSKGILKTHMLIHGEKKYLCSECGKGFVSNAGLQSHFKVHSGARPYSCSICSKAFSQLGSLKAHMCIHTGEKPFMCSICSKAFTQRNHLKYHMRTHSGERPYMCSYCGKKFSLNGTLTVHLRTHTGETPYICSVCGKGFYDSSSMKKHKKGHGELADAPMDVTPTEITLV